MNRDQLVDLFRQMLLIRRFEEKAAEMYALGKVGGFLHLYIGEEAVAVGAVSAMKQGDHLVTHYRDHGYALAIGATPRPSWRNCLARPPVYPRVRVAPCTWPMSNGTSGAATPSWADICRSPSASPSPPSTERTNEVVLCVLGDGATNIGEFHESLNLAALWRLPIVFLVENNSYGMGTEVGRASAVKFMHAKGCAYGMSGRQVDGMDVLQVRDA